MALSGSAIRAGQAYIEITATDAKMQEAFDKAKSKFDGFAARMGRAGAVIRNIGAGIVAPMALAVGKFMSEGDKFDKMSSRTGASVEWLSEMEFVASQAGTGIEVVEAGMRKLSKSIGDAGMGMKSYLDALESIGLNYEGLSALSPEKQFDAMAAALENVQDQSVRTQAAMTLMGRSATAMFPMFQGAKTRADEQQGSQARQASPRPAPPQGSQALTAKRAEARSLGLTISKTDTDNAAKLTDAWDVLKRQMGMTVVKIGSALAPALIRLARAMAPLLSRLVAFVRQNPELIVQIASAGAGMLAAGTSVNILARSFSGLGTAISIVGKLAMCVKGLVSAFSLPAAACVAFGSAVYVGTQQVLKYFFDLDVGISDVARDMFRPVGDECEDAFETIRKAFSAGEWMQALSLSWETVKLGASACWAYLREGWEGLKYTVLSVAYDAGYDLLSAWESATSGIADMSAALGDTLKGFWYWALDGISERVERVANIIKRLVRSITDAAKTAWNLLKALDPNSSYTWDNFRRDRGSMQREELKKRVEEDTESGQNVSRRTEEGIARSRQDYEARERRRAQSDEYLRALEQERRRSRDALERATARNMQDIAKALGSQKENLKAAVKKTRESVAADDAPKPPPLKKFAAPKTDRTQKAEKQYNFSSDATAAFLASSFALSAQTVSIKDIAKNVKKIRDNTDRAQDDDMEFGQ